MFIDSMINLRNWNFGENRSVEIKKERKKEHIKGKEKN